MAKNVSKAFLRFDPGSAFRFPALPTLFWLFLSLIMCVTRVSGAQLNPDNGKNLFDEIEANQAHIARQRIALNELTRLDPYFQSTFDQELISDNLTKCGNLLSAAKGSLPYLRFEAAGQNLVSCRPFMDAADVMLKEDSATSSARFHQNKREDYSVPVEIMAPTRGLETRTSLSNQLSLTQRLVSRIGVDLLRDSYSDKDRPDQQPACIEAKNDFNRQLGYPDNIFSKATMQLHLLQYDSVHDTVWKTYISGQRVAAACKIR